MSPKATRTTKTESEAISAEIGNPVPEEEIRLRAYEIFLERGEQPDRELDDWLQAERELQRRDL
jgi:hypothetical protein